jgi:hypothetical protein
MKKKSAAWGVRELKAIEELYQYGRCSVELRDALTEQVFKRLEEENTVTRDKECKSEKTKRKDGKPRRRSRST